jgi:uncharacterized membrane protein
MRNSKYKAFPYLVFVLWGAWIALTTIGIFSREARDLFFYTYHVVVLLLAILVTLIVEGEKKQ